MKISIDKIKEGVKYSKEKCIRHLEYAELLASNGYPDLSLGNLESAIEEFGRSIILNENLKDKLEEVDDKIKYNHSFKYDKAWEILPEKFKTIYQGTFDPNIFDPKIFDTSKETISPRTRLRATYVDFDDKTKQWSTGIRADPEMIIELSNQIKNSMDTITWY